MPEATQISYTNEELLRLLMKDQGIKSGQWRLTVEFALAAANVPNPNTPGEFSPAGIAIVNRVGLAQAGSAPNGVAIDARTGRRLPNPPMPDTAQLPAAAVGGNASAQRRLGPAAKAAKRPAARKSTRS